MNVGLRYGKYLSMGREVSISIARRNMVFVMWEQQEGEPQSSRGSEAPFRLGFTPSQGCLLVSTDRDSLAHYSMLLDEALVLGFITRGP